MSNRRFEMYQYRQVLVRIRQGDSDRNIAHSGIMGRKKIAQVRQVAKEQGWLNPDIPLPDDLILATHFAPQQTLPSSCTSSLEPWRTQITQWHASGIQGTTICSALARNHGFKGSYLAVYRPESSLIILNAPLPKPVFMILWYSALTQNMPKAIHSKCSFLPLREFRSLADANQQLQQWVLGEAGNRTHGTTHERPLSRFINLEKSLLISLPGTS